MAKKKKEQVVEETTQETKVKEPKDDVTKVKEKMKMKPQIQEETITKVDLTNPPKTEKEDAVQEPKTEEVDVEKQTGDGEKVDGGGEESVIEEIKSEESVQDEETPVLKEITEEAEEAATAIEEAITESIETGKDLPESVEKLINFMNETGGDLNDYLTLNQDFSEMDNQTLLNEYYKKTKPHLDSEEISFLMEDQFSYDEELDDERSIKRKKLALKEQVANAKSHLDGLKSRYYEDIKAGSKLTGEQQKAWEFFNRYKRESAEQTTVNKRQHKTFLNKTNKLFDDGFKGFEYNIGEKKFRFNVKDKDSIKSNQSDINNFIGKFLNEKNEMSDADGYHKSLFTAMNPDAVANHFYEQGKADALKDSIAKSKNISMDPRQQHSGEINAGGIKVKVLGENSNDFKFKIKQK